MNTNIIALDRLKSMLQISDDTKDDLLNVMIESCQDYVAEQCGISTFPKGLQIFAYKWIQFYIQPENSTISSMKEGNLSFNYVNELPNSIQALLDPYLQPVFSYDKSTVPYINDDPTILIDDTLRSRNR